MDQWSPNIKEVWLEAKVLSCFFLPPYQLLESLTSVPWSSGLDLTSFQFILEESPSFCFCSTLCPKESQRSLASTETSGGRSYPGRPFPKLGTQKKERKNNNNNPSPNKTKKTHPGSDFLHSQTLSWNPTAPQPQNKTAAWSIMVVVFKTLHVQTGKNRRMSKTLERNGWFLNMKSLAR